MRQRRRSLRSLLGRVRALPVLRTFTPFAWLVTVVGFAAWVGAWRLGWTELAVVAGASAVLMVGSLVFVMGRSSLVATLELQPKRVTVGSRAAGQVVVANRSGRRQLPTNVELRVGEGRGEFHVPSLADGAEHDELFTIPAARRAVLPVGPVAAVRGDPLGLCRAEKLLSGVEELFIHPRISTLERLGSGFLKDLEGQTTNDLSNSDIAFHTLREYVPGDDRRHVHWKTSAKLGQLMVRQYVDTRRSHLALVISTSPGDYADEDEFELAVSLAASLAVRTLRDDQAVSMSVGAKSVPTNNPQAVLDGLARVEIGVPVCTLVEGCAHSNQTAARASIVALVTGAGSTLPDVRAATTRLATDARVLVLRADLHGELRYQPIGSMALVNVPTLDDFAHGLWRASQR